MIKVCATVFLQTDPLDIAEPSTGQSTYIYGNNNPLVNVDPSGLQSQNPCMTPAGLPEPNGCSPARVYPTPPVTSAPRVPVASKSAFVPAYRIPQGTPSLDPVCRYVAYSWSLCLAYYLLSDERSVGYSTLDDAGFEDRATWQKLLSYWGVDTVRNVRQRLFGGTLWKMDGTHVTAQSISLTLIEVVSTISTDYSLGEGGVNKEDYTSGGPGGAAGVARKLSARSLQYRGAQTRHRFVDVVNQAVFFPPGGIGQFEFNQGMDALLAGKTLLKSGLRPEISVSFGF